MRERDNTLDLIKGIAIILVCLYHTYYLNKEGIPYVALYSLCSIGVPLFFFVNGALLFTSPLDIKKHYKKIGKLCLLTIIWAILILGTIKIFILPKGEMSWPEFVKTLWYLKTGYVINQYWFLQALIMLYIFFPVLKRTFDSDKCSLALFAVIIFLFTFGNKFLYVAHQIILFWQGKGLMETVKNYIPWYNCLYNMHYAFAFSYFLVGGLMYHYIRNRSASLENNFIRYKSTLFITFFLAWWLSVQIAQWFTSAMTWDPCFEGYDLVTTFLMTYSFCLVVTNVQIERLPHWIALVSRNTLGIYLIHGILIYITKPWISALSSLHNIFCYTLYVAVILTVSLFIVLVAKQVPLIKLLFKF